MKHIYLLAALVALALMAHYGAYIGKGYAGDGAMLLVGTVLAFVGAPIMLLVYDPAARSRA